MVATVEDDGRGFDPTSAEEGPGLGLAAMRERVESAGGRLASWSVPGTTGC
jgi:signal transduction histidine kinase